MPSGCRADDRAVAAIPWLPHRPVVLEARAFGNGNCPPFIHRNSEHRMLRTRRQGVVPMLFVRIKGDRCRFSAVAYGLGLREIRARPHFSSHFSSEATSSASTSFENGDSYHFRLWCTCMAMSTNGNCPDFRTVPIFSRPELDRSHAQRRPSVVTARLVCMRMPQTECTLLRRSLLLPVRMLFVKPINSGRSRLKLNSVVSCNTARRRSPGHASRVTQRDGGKNATPQGEGDNFGGRWSRDR